MQFSRILVTNAGQRMLAEAATGKKIIWGTVQTTAQSATYTDEEIRAFSTLPNGADGHQGSVTSSVANDNKITLHCEVRNTSGTQWLRYIGVYAKLENEAQEQLILMAKNDENYFRIREQPPLIKLFIDIAVNLTDYVATAVTVDASNYAQAGALEATNEAIQEMSQNRWRIYKDYWEALEKSKDGEWFSIANKPPRAAIFESYGGIDIQSGADAGIAVINHFGPWLLCYAINGDQDEAVIGISHVRDMLAGGDEIEPRHIVKHITGNDAGNGIDAELLWVDGDKFLYRESGTNRWSTGETAPQDINFHRSSAGLIGIKAVNQSKVVVMKFNSITPGNVEDYEVIYEETNNDADAYVNNGIFASVAIMGKPKVFYMNDPQNAMWGEITRTGVGRFTATAITSAENALITINGEKVTINGTVTTMSDGAGALGRNDTVLAVDCASRKYGWWGVGAEGLTRGIAEGVVTDYFGHESTTEQGITEIESTLDTTNGQTMSLAGIKTGFHCFSQQPTGFLSFGDPFSNVKMGVIPWRGSYSRMVNRNGFLLPYLD